MFGTYRFILALAVTFDHQGLFPAFHAGFAAVMGFFVLSGYVMARSFSKFFGSDLRLAHRFYLDRALRIYPAYLLVAAVVLVFCVLTEWSRTGLTLVNGLATLTLLPLNFWRILDPQHLYVLRDHTQLLVPPSPTVAIELQYYLLLPLLLVHRWLAYVGFVITLGVFTVSSAGLLHHSLGENYLSGLLFIFLSGSFLYDPDGRWWASRGRPIVIGTAGYLGALLIYLSWAGRAGDSVFLELIVGFELGVVLTCVLARAGRSFPLDSFLGDLSYPLFLTHTFAIWLFEFLEVRYPLPAEPRARIVLQVVLALALSTALWLFFDSPVQRFRKSVQLRRRPEPPA